MTITDILLNEIDVGRKGKNWGYTQGLPKLEALTDGLTKSTYTLLFASSGIGKTNLALYAYVYRPIMEHLDDGKLRITYFALEMKAEFILAKLLCTYIYETFGVDLSMKEVLSRKKDYSLSDDNYELIQKSIPWLRKVEKILTIYDKAINAESMYAILMTELEQEGSFTKDSKHSIYIPNNPDLLHLTVIDHLALITPTKSRTKKQEMDLASSEAVSLRNRTNMSFLFIMQSNRAVASMDRKKQGFNEPMCEDIKETGNPSEDAEIILAVYNPNVDHLATYRGYDIAQLGDNFRSILCLKSRYGEARAADCCYFNGKVNKWEELPNANKIYDYSVYTNKITKNETDIEKKKNLKFTI